jgi:hypothetical protein
MTVTLDGHSLTLDDLVAIAHHAAPVSRTVANATLRITEP